jgi:hypothetical protein
MSMVGNLGPGNLGPGMVNYRDIPLTNNGTSRCLDLDVELPSSSDYVSYVSQIW